MLKSISNIAWPATDEEWALEELQRRGWNAIEVAPSRVWEDFRKITTEERKLYLDKIKSYNLQVCSLHSLFFGIEGADIFGTDTEQKIFVQYLLDLVDLASDLEAKVLILGSPKVRNRKNYRMEQAMAIAAQVLREPAQYANEKNIKILIEPLSKKETNFINTHDEGLELVELVNNNGFGLHLDEKAVVCEEGSIENNIKECENKFWHFHINEIDLTRIIYSEQHNTVAETLKNIKYSNYISIEMRTEENYRDAILKSLDCVDFMYKEQ